MSSGTHEHEVTVRRLVRATPARVFAAWTEPAHLLRWWGPGPVTCSRADVDLRVGGAFSLTNDLPDGGQVVISGRYDDVDPPHRLAYSWTVTPGEHREHSRVEVTFRAQGSGTEVEVTHTRIPSATVRHDHQQGWLGCLEGLAEHLDRPVGD